VAVLVCDWRNKECLEAKRYPVEILWLTEKSRKSENLGWTLEVWITGGVDWMLKFRLCFLELRLQLKIHRYQRLEAM